MIENALKWRLSQLRIAIILSLCTLCTASSLAQDSLSLAEVDLIACAGVEGGTIAMFDLVAHESVLIDGQSGVTLTWYEDEELTQSITPTVDYTSEEGTLYIVGMTSDPDLFDTIAIQLIVDDLRGLDFIEQLADTVCGPLDGFMFSLPPSPAGTYNWSPGRLFEDSTAANPVFRPEADGDTYTISVEATLGDAMCQTSASVTFLYLEARLDIDAEDIVFYCKTDDVLLPLTLSAITSGNPTDITWSSSRDTLSSLTGPTTTITPEFNTLIIASQSFDNGCFLSDTILIQVDSLPPFDLERVEDLEQPCMKYCPGKLVSIIANAVDKPCYPDIAYSWTPNGDNGGDILDGQDTTANTGLRLSNGNTQNYIRTTRNNACIERDTQLVEVVDTLPMLGTLPDRVCRGDQIRIDIDPNYVADGSYTEIRWSIGTGGTLNCGDCEDQTSVLVTIDDDAAGSVSLQVQGIKEECCSATGTISIPIDVPRININPSVFCPEEEKLLIATPANFTDWRWSAQGTDIGSDENRAVITTDQLGTYLVRVFATDPDGCPGEGLQNVLVTDAEMNISFDPPILLAGVGQSVTATAEMSPPASEPITWTVDGEEVARGDSYEFTLEFGEFELCASGVSAAGCEAQACQTIERLFEVFIPNVFAPADNMNELNQTFRPFVPSPSGDNVPMDPAFIVDMLVFNRWGQLVYENEDNANGWDGTQDGEDAPSDVFTYKITIRNANGDEQVFTGDVTLLR